MEWNMKNINYSHKYTSLSIIEPKLTNSLAMNPKLTYVECHMRVIIPQIKPLLRKLT